MANEPIYSICITNYNSEKTVRKAMESIHSLLQDKRFEAVVVDNFSDDGSYAFLQELHRDGMIRTIKRMKCSRGTGRNEAFLLSRGKYIMANIDMDVIYDAKKIMGVLDDYHRRFEGKVLSVFGMMILPRDVAVMLGGWKNLDRHEDNEIALNAFTHNLHAQDLTLNVINEHLNTRNGIIDHIIVRYEHYRDLFRIGFKASLSKPGERIRPEFMIARVLYRLKPCFIYREFSSYYETWTSKKIYGENMNQ